MKKLTKALVAAMMIVAITTAILIGCKKENQMQESNAKQNTEIQTLLDRIVAFQKLHDASCIGEKAEGSISILEMYEILSLVSNYEHSEHMLYTENTVLDTIKVPMPFVDEGGLVSVQDVLSVYTTFEENLQKKMEDVEDNRSIASVFSFVLPEVGAKDSDIDVVYTRGELSDDDNPIRDYPFELGDDRFWGKQLGRCDHGLTNPSDAAEELTNCFTFDRTPPEEGWQLILTDAYYVIYTVYHKPQLNWQIHDPVVNTTCTDHWLFIDSVLMDYEPCITWEELNCYCANMNAEVVNDNAPLHYHNFWLLNIPYFEAEFQDHEYPNIGNTISKFHNVKITYARYYWYHPEL